MAERFKTLSLTGGAVVDELAACPWTAVAGFGCYWVKNDGTPQFRDDAGTDHNLLTAAGSKAFIVLYPREVDYEGAVGEPAAGSTNDRHHLSFGQGDDDTARWHKVMPSNYAGGNFSVTIKWCPSNDAAGNVKWDVCWERLAEGANMAADSFAAEQTVTTPVDTQLDKLVFSAISFTSAQVDGVVANDLFRLQVQRDVSVGGNYGNSAELYSVTIAEV